MCVPIYISGLHQFGGEIFAYVTFFIFISTIEVVTFRLHGYIRVMDCPCFRESPFSKTELTLSPVLTVCVLYYLFTSM